MKPATRSGLFTLFFVTVSHAQNTWNTTTGNWNVPGNWSAGVPVNGVDFYVNNGGTVQIGTGITARGSRGTLGELFGQSGNLTISGTASLTLQDELRIGDAGTGTLNFSGGSIIDTVGNIGRSAGSTGTVNMSGGTWESTWLLAVGNEGNGTLNLSGGLVMARHEATYIGRLASGVGVATVSGGTWLSLDALYAGHEGTGTLNLIGDGVVDIRNGGNISGGGDMVVAGFNGSTGTLNFGAYDLLNPTSAGTLYARKIVFGTGTGVVNFNQNDTFTLNTTLAQQGRLVQRGDGTTIFTGATEYFGSSSIPATLAGTLTIKQGSFIISGASANFSTVSVRKSLINVGETSGDVGTFIVRNGATVSNYGSYIGQWVGSSGAATVMGAGSNWFIEEGSFHLGYQGTGTLTLADGGTLTVGGGTGTVEMSAFAAGSTLNFGSSDLANATTSGTLNAANISSLNNASTVNFNQTNTLTLGQKIDVIGKLVQRGSGTTILTGEVTAGTGDLDPALSSTLVKKGTLMLDGAEFMQPTSGSTVGESAGDYGTLIFRNGTTASDDATYIGRGAGSSGSVIATGNGTSWNPYVLEVGTDGAGTLEISDGALVDSTGVQVGLNAAGNGEVLVTGAGSRLRTGDGSDLHVGDLGTGTLTLAEGGAVTVENGLGTVHVAMQSGSTGTLNFGSHDLTAPTTAGVLNASTIIFGAGTGNINFNQTGTLTLDADISGNGGVTQRGSGTTILTGVNSYGGPTTVSNGTLLVNNFITSDVTVQSGATFGGSGAVYGDVTLESGAMLRPDGSLDASSLIWNSGATLIFELGTGSSDLLFLSDTLMMGGTGEFAFTFEDAGWQIGETYTLLTSGGTTSFDADDFSFTNPDGFGGTFTVEGDSLQFTLASIPEPSALVLAGIGFLGLLVHRPRHA